MSSTSSYSSSDEPVIPTRQSYTIAHPEGTFARARSSQATITNTSTHLDNPANRSNIFDWTSIPGLQQPFGHNTAFGQTSIMFGETSTAFGQTPSVAFHSKANFEDERRRHLQYFESDGAQNGGGVEEMIRTTPLFSFATKCKVDGRCPDLAKSSGGVSNDEKDLALYEQHTNPILPHYGLLGFDVNERSKPEPILLNTNAPNSVFICGSQGSGKSYTLSCMLEACLLPNQEKGTHKDPIAGVVFHYDTNAAGEKAEIASLATRGIKVNILVSRSAYKDLSTTYANAPASENITVRPLLFEDRHLTVDRMNKLMAFTNAEGSVPLYMEVIQRILRQTKIDGQAFSLARFEQQLDNENFDRTQQNMLNMRMGLLKSFCSSVVQRDVGQLPKKAQAAYRRVHGLEVGADPFRVKAGELTIIDLSDPFIEPTTACVLFYVCLGIVNANKPDNGLILALDEAHKFLDKATDAANIFTDQLLTTIREQRHNATRVIIATQEPTISERLLDLSSMSIVHRFTSPAWFDAIKNHLGGASKMLAGIDEQKEMFERIVELQVGESLVFSPSSFVRLDEDGKPQKLGTGVMKMKTRKREGVDAGRSVLVKR